MLLYFLTKAPVSNICRLDCPQLHDLGRQTQISPKTQIIYQHPHFLWVSFSHADSVAVHLNRFLLFE